MVPRVQGDTSVHCGARPGVKLAAVLKPPCGGPPPLIRHLTRSATAGRLRLSGHSGWSVLDNCSRILADPVSDAHPDREGDDHVPWPTRGGTWPISASGWSASASPLEEVSLWAENQPAGAGRTRRRPRCHLRPGEDRRTRWIFRWGRKGFPRTKRARQSIAKLQGAHTAYANGCGWGTVEGSFSNSWAWPSEPPSAAAAGVASAAGVREAPAVPPAPPLLDMSSFPSFGQARNFRDWHAPPARGPPSWAES